MKVFQNENGQTVIDNGEFELRVNTEHLHKMLMEIVSSMYRGNPPKVDKGCSLTIEGPFKFKYTWGERE